MQQNQIERINQLARKSRTPQGLTPAEQAEQAALRREYIDSMKSSLRAQLGQIEVLDENGVRRPLQKKQG